MGSTVIVAEKTATVLRMVEIALKGLSMDIQGVDHGEAALQALRDCPSTLLIAHESLPDMSGYELVQTLRADENLKHLPVLLLLDRNESIDQSQLETLGAIQGLNLPFKTQALVERVCTALQRDVPDAALYAPYLMEIPLANPSKTKAPEEPALLPVADDDDLLITTERPIATTAGAEAPLPIEAPESAPALMTGFDPDQTADKDNEASAQQSVEPEPADTSAETEVFTVERPEYETQELAESELQSVIEYGSSAYLQTEDDLDSVNEDEVITNAIRPAPPVAPMPDLDELVAHVRDTLAEGAGFRGALGEVSRGVIEEIAWEVVPALAEAILKEEITRMIREGQTPT